MKPMLRSLRDSSDFELQLVATDQHVNVRFGYTLQEIKKEFNIIKGVSIFVSAGYPHYAVGISAQSNYNNNGLLLTASVGGSPGWTEVSSFKNTNIAYQWRFNRLFATLGINYWDAMFTDDYEYSSNILPVVSLHYRF